MTIRHRVLLIEDEATIVRVIEILLSTEPDFELVGSASTAEEGIRLARELNPDVVLLDNQLEGLVTGLQAAPEIREAAPGVVLLLCTALDLAAAAAAESAVDGYLRKNDLVDLVDVLRALLEGTEGRSG